MKKFGLIGHPIAHSLSPALFKAAYKGKYSYDLIETDDFEKAFDILMDEYDAVNVTAPFKELAFRAADAPSESCKAVGAANILTKSGEDHFVTAQNSDIDGVIGAIEAAGMSKSESRKALVVGCGGAAMAAAYAVWQHFGYETVIINRNIDKAMTFVKRMKETVRCETPISSDGLDRFAELFREADVIIYNLPVPIPALSELTRRDLRGNRFWRRSRRKVILEANYKDPAFTPNLMESMQNVNPKIEFISGKEWLLYQAVGAYRHFGLPEPDMDAMREVIA